MGVKRKVLLSLIFIGFLVLLCIAQGTYAEDNLESNNPTKIFLIVFDALRADHLSCYGYHRVTSPTIDLLASEGIICLHHYTQGLNTFFSVPTIMYGRYFPPMLHESLDAIECVRETDDDELLISEIFRVNGYKTLFITTHSWFTKDSPLVQSFDETIFVRSDINLIPKFEDLNKELFRWIEKHKNERFFVYIHLIDTHFPHLIADPYDKWITEELKNNISEDRRKELAWGNNERDITKPLTTFEIEFLNAIYDGSILYSDEQLSRLIDKLKSHDVLKDSLLILCSDHGELLGEDGMLWGHPPIAYDAMLRTPLIIYGKGIPKNIKITAITENVDIVPTLVDLLDLNTTATFDGLSLLNLMLETKQSEQSRQYAFSKCFYLEPESFQNLMTIEKGYESHQMFVLATESYKIEYHEIDDKYFFWTKEMERDFIVNKKFVETKKFPFLDQSHLFPQEFENAKIHFRDKIFPKFKKYKQSFPTIYFIPFSPFTIPKYVCNRNDVVCHSGDFEKYTTDNKWGFDMDSLMLWTQPWNETVVPLQFSFEIKQGEYDLYLKLPCLENFYGKPMSSVKLSDINGQSGSLETGNCKDMIINYYKVTSIKVGDDNKLSILFDVNNKNMWCSLTGIKLVNKNVITNKDKKTLIPSETHDEKTNDSKKLPTEERVIQLKNLGYL